LNDVGGGETIKIVKTEKQRHNGRKFEKKEGSISEINKLVTYPYVA